ncbi:MAG: FHA domain-containing protein [Deltaproteobacteria bacterium]|nr:FHA domain-containing protein [Deltaproteobacteria bacterium]
MAKRPPVTTATTSPVRPADGTTRPRRLTLVWSGGGSPARFMVPPGSGRRLVLGREPSGGGFDVPTDTEMSRSHAELTHIPEFDVLRLSDLNSKNGTFFNGKRVESDYVPRRKRHSGRRLIVCAQRARPRCGAGPGP